MLAAKYAPDVVKYLSGSDTAATVTGKVVEIAQTVTGKSNPTEAALSIDASPELQAQFRTAVMQNETQLQQMYLADVQSARNRDIALAQAGVHNYRANVLVAAAILLVVCCLLLVVWNSTMDEYVKATISLILGRALGWIEQIFSFEFGTTRANKVKDDTIKNLSSS